MADIQKVWARLWKSTEVDPVGGCWNKTTDLKLGYAMILVDGRKRRAHHVAYELFVGPIPEGMQLDHVCHTISSDCPGGDACPHRRCWRPGHLEPVTPRENVRRSQSPPSVNAAKTHCVHGHLFDEVNTYARREGGRRCRTCKRIRDRR